MNFDLADSGRFLAWLNTILDDEAEAVAPDIDARIVSHRGRYFDRLPDHGWVSGPFEDLVQLYERRGAEVERTDDGHAKVSWQGAEYRIDAEGHLTAAPF